MAPTSLLHLAQRSCIKHLRSIKDIGGIPYDLIRPVLMKLEYPEQLRELERNCPQLVGLDAEIWLEFIKRDVPNWESKSHKPKRPENWYKVYKKLRLENQNEVERDAEVLEAAMQGIKTERAKHTSKVVDPTAVPKLPRMGGMRPEAGRKKSDRPITGNNSLLTFASGSKTKTNTGSDILRKVRRESREASLFSAKNSVLNRPTHELVNMASSIRSAPQGLVSQHRNPAPIYVDIKKPAVASSVQPHAPKASVLHPMKRPAVKEAPTQPTSKDEALADTDYPHGFIATSKPQRIHTGAASSPPLIYKSPATPTARPAMKKKAPVDIFMPTKRRKAT